MKKSIKTRRTLIQACFTLCLFIFLKELYSLQQWDMKNYYAVEEDIMFPSIKDFANFSPRPNSIYFHVTSFEGYIRPVEACAVEAAARAHPKQNVYVLFTSPIRDIVLKSSMKASVKKLKLFPNIKLMRVHLPEYSNGTIVESLLLNVLKNSSYPELHTADILKMLTLNKYGGVAVNTDMIILRSLHDLPKNWILKNKERYVAPGIMKFSKNEFGFNITSAVLKEITETYNPTDYYITGSVPIEKVVQRICPIRIRWDSCSGIAIYDLEQFYSVETILWTSYNKLAMSQVSFSFHINSLVKKEYPVTSQAVIEKFCPSMYLEFLDNLIIWSDTTIINSGVTQKLGATPWGPQAQRAFGYITNISI